jgi:methyltransferase (TIGR00027 family)
LKEGQASRTAEYMALFRALESARPADQRLFADPYAPAFLDPKLRLLAKLSRNRFFNRLICAYIDHRWAGARATGVARTVYIDRAIATAVTQKIDQVVILGAGFDARAHRIPALSHTTVFEVDHPSTSAAKSTAIKMILGSDPAHVRYVPVDFGSESLGNAMTRAGWDPKRKTFFLWEGVTNYLTEAAVDKTLRWCGSAARDSRIVFTYVHRRVFDSPEEFVGTVELFEALRKAGETWHFGLDPQELPHFLAERGFVPLEDLGAQEFRSLCLGPAAKDVHGYEFYRIAVAIVQ